MFAVDGRVAVRVRGGLDGEDVPVRAEMLPKHGVVRFHDFAALDAD